MRTVEIIVHVKNRSPVTIVVRRLHKKSSLNVHRRNHIIQVKSRSQVQIVTKSSTEVAMD